MIKEIYHGDFRPVDNAGMSDDYQEKRQVAHMLSIQFAKKINTEIKEDFEKVLEAYMEVLVAGQRYVLPACLNVSDLCRMKHITPRTGFSAHGVKSCIWRI